MSISSLFSGFNRSVDTTTVKAYFELPEKDREHLGFWYLRPYALPWNASMLLKGRSRLACGEEGWAEWEDRIKSIYPVQHFIREVVSSKIRIWIGSRRRWWYEHVAANLNPRQKWLTKKIPNTYCDKVELIPIVMFEMVVDLVEGEKCFETINYEADPDQAKFARELKECYNFIKTTLPELQRQHDAAYPENPTGDYEEDYKLVHQYGKEIEEQTTKWLTWIVINRSGFWT